MTKRCSREEIEVLVTTCAVRRYSTKESLEFLQSNGANMSERTFFKLKNKSKSEIGKRTRVVLENLVSDHLRRIREFEEIGAEMWRIYRNSKNDHLKLNALNSIINVQNQQAKLVIETLGMVERQEKWISALPIGNRLDAKNAIEERKRALAEPYVDTRDPYEASFSDGGLTADEINKNRAIHLKRLLADDKTDSS